MENINIIQQVWLCEETGQCDMLPCPGHDKCPLFAEGIVDEKSIHMKYDNINP